MKKTKADMEKEIKFLKLQLKIIKQLTDECNGKNHDEIFEILGAIDFYTNNYDENFEFIVKHNLPYNFYNKTMTV